MSTIKRLLRSLKKNGIGYIFSLGLKKLQSLFTFVFLYPFRKAKYEKLLSQLPVSNRIFLWTVKFGWNVPLFQRPQHIARFLAEKGNTVFYFNDPMYDTGIDTLQQIAPNLYLVNRDNYIFVRLLRRFLEKHTGHKYFHLYSTNWETSVSALKEYEQAGFHVLYEYIDDLAPEIAEFSKLPVNIQEKFDYATADNHIPMTVTADLLRQQIIGLRGDKNLAFSTNGVDPEHFRNIKEDFVFNDVFQKVLNRGNKIVGYYGAMAKWMDYDLLKYVAAQLPDVDFVLIGKKYDDSFDASGVDAISNIHFIGPVPYADLPQYAAKFDICSIPFVVNSITNATSPLKLFEYMALGKPVLTTAMQESAKYDAVNIATDAEDFAQKVLQLLSYTPDTQPAYFNLLDETANANSWSAKTDIILEMLREYEAQSL